MKCLWLTIGLCLALNMPALGANPDVKPQPPATPLISPGEVASTPEMWFYQQYQQQYATPQAMVRQKADTRAVERHQRLAAMKWYGMSNQRPRAGVDPLNGDYAPTWTSGNGLYPSRWQPYAAPWVILPGDR